MPFAVSCNFSSFSFFLFDLSFRVAYVCSGAAPSLGLCILQVRSRTHRCSCSVVQSSLSSSTTEATEVPGSHVPVAARARPPLSAGEGRGHHRGIAPSDLCYGLGHDQA